jgi:hypothetical protein
MGNLDDAFVALLKGVTILLEIVPKAPELNKADELYVKSRNVSTIFNIRN